MKKGTILLIVFASLILLLSNAFAEIVSITEIQPMNDARALFGSTLGIDGNIYVFGGVNATGYGFSGVESYNPNTNSWTNLSSLPAPMGWQQAATATDGIIYLFGGSSNSTPSSTVWAYNPSTNMWDTSIQQMPIAERDTIAVTANDGSIYLFGGSGNGNAVQAFNPATGIWSIKSSMPIGQWGGAGDIGPNGKIYIATGSALEVYNPLTDSWEIKSSIPTTRTYLGAAFGTDGLFYTVGGYVYGTTTVYDIIEAYNPLSDTWTTAGYLPEQLTYIPDSVVSDDSGNIYVLGGNLYPQGLSNRVFLISTTGSIPPPVVPEPISSVLFITGGAILAGRKYFEKKA